VGTEDAVEAELLDFCDDRDDTDDRDDAEACDDIEDRLLCRDTIVHWIEPTLVWLPRRLILREEERDMYRATCQKRPESRSSLDAHSLL